MKFITTLSNDEIDSLESICKTSPIFRIRQRAHAILLSYKKFPMKSLAEIFDVDRDTVSAWLKSWELEGLEGLSDKPRSGRPSILTEEDRQKLEELIIAQPNQTKMVHAKLSEEINKSFSCDTLKRALKKNSE